MKVMTVVGTRPELIRLSRILAKFEEVFDHVLIHTGQNFDYELSEIFFKDLGIKPPAEYLNVKGTPMEVVGNTLVGVEKRIETYEPDALVVLGDTFSCLSSLAGKMLKVPVFHLEAGNRCFDDRVPEEILRRIVDSIADVNMVYSENERFNLIREGHHPEFVLKTGSPMYEVSNYYLKHSDESDILDRLGLQANEYFVFSAHRAEHISNDNKFDSIVNILRLLHEQYGKRIIFTTHPRTRKRLAEKEVLLPSTIEFHKPFSYSDYLKLQKNAIVTLSDSGTLSEESAILGFAAINLRGSQERPAAMDEGNILLSNLNPEHIMQMVNCYMENRLSMADVSAPADYSKNNVSEIVVRQIMSFVQSVNRKVWFKASDL